jgi:HAD superfamily hydrolase (TIGR01549 family)
MPDFKLISFDVDDTLWDFAYMMRQGMAAVSAILTGQSPAFAHLTPDYLLERYAAACIGHNPALMPWTELRRRVFRTELAAAGHPDAEVYSYEVIARYLRVWKDNLRLYPGALEMLDALRGRWPLAWTTNGNFGPEIANLTAYFDIVIMPDRIGISKPDPAVFHYAAAQAGCGVGEIMHVGDSLYSDVGGAKAAGCTAVWFNPHGRANDTEHVPDVTITHLDEVIKLVDGTSP